MWTNSQAEPDDEGSPVSNDGRGLKLDEPGMYPNSYNGVRPLAMTGVD